MNLQPDNPRLTDLLLGELPADEAAAMAQAVAEDPILQNEARELAALHQALSEALVPQSRQLLPNQRQVILQAARVVGQPAVPNPREVDLITTPRPWRPPPPARNRWLRPLCAAAAVLVLAAAVSFPYAKRTSQASAPTTQSPSIGRTAPAAPPHPSPGPTMVAEPGVPRPAPLVKGSGLPVLRARGFVTAIDGPTLELPVQAGDSSLAWIQESIRQQHKLPPRDAVRLEEILNRFQLHPTGLTVIARQAESPWHPDDRSTGVTTHAATMTTETVACPWQPSASLVFVSIRGNPATDCDVKAVFHADPTKVRSYRLLGFASVDGHSQAALPTRIPAKTGILLCLEVESASPTGDFGVIEWSVNDQSAAPITLARHGDNEPSDDSRFAALVCAYAQWLSDPTSGKIDRELLAALAREIAAPNLPADRADFLTLINESLAL